MWAITISISLQYLISTAGIVLKCAGITQIPNRSQTRTLWNWIINAQFMVTMTMNTVLCNLSFRQLKTILCEQHSPTPRGIPSDQGYSPTPRGIPSDQGHSPTPRGITSDQGYFNVGNFPHFLHPQTSEFLCCCLCRTWQQVSSKAMLSADNWPVGWIYWPLFQIFKIFQSTWQCSYSKASELLYCVQLFLIRK